MVEKADSGPTSLTHTGRNSQAAPSSRSRRSKRATSRASRLEEKNRTPKDIELQAPPEISLEPSNTQLQTLGGPHEPLDSMHKIEQNVVEDPGIGALGNIYQASQSMDSFQQIPTEDELLEALRQQKLERDKAQEKEREIMRKKAQVKHHLEAFEVFRENQIDDYYERERAQQVRVERNYRKMQEAKKRQKAGQEMPKEVQAVERTPEQI